MHIKLSCLLASVLFSAVPSISSAQQPATDATFVFTDDTHVSFNGSNDSEGITWEGGSPTQTVLILNETATSIYSPFSHHDGCLGYGFSVTKDLCNQIQQIRKLNALPQNAWKNSTFTQHGHTRQMASAGQTIHSPLGVLIGGDLTDCGGGSDDKGCDNGGYKGGKALAQYLAFTQLYDKDWIRPGLQLSSLSFLQGLTNPDADVPLKYHIYPGLGNHDLGFTYSSTMQAYVDSWSPLSPLHRVTNSNSTYHTYSFDFGKVHIVNVGVFPGSNNDNNDYPFDQKAMDWLANDLSTFASDGRPVIIYSHFGFDSYSMNTSWWGGSNRIAGYNKLWSVIQNYNVIGYFTGHNHTQTGPITISQSAGKMPIDAFQPGAAYHQDFAVVRVTDKSMDVMYTSPSNDFDNSSKKVNFGTAYTKQLAAPPQPVCSAPDVAGENNVISFVSNGKTYLLGTTVTGMYHVRLLSGCMPTLIAQGALGTFPVASSMLATYTAGTTTHILALGGGNLFDYTLYTATTQPSLVLSWKQAGISGSTGMVFNYNNANYLLLDKGVPLQPEIYAITKTGVTLLSSLANKVGIATQSLVPFSYQLSGQKLPGYIRTTNMGVAEFHYLSPNGSSFDDHLLNTEYWTAGSHAAAAQGISGRTQIMVATDSCQTGGDPALCVAFNSDSPYSIHTVLSDQQGTDISWHGWRGGLAPNAQALFQIGVNGQNAVFGGYNKLGIYFQFELLPN